MPTPTDEPVHPDILRFDRLKQLSDTRSAEDVSRWLVKHGIAHLHDTSGDPFTTVQAIDRVLRDMHNDAMED